jgi:hypothetical protein
MAKSSLFIFSLFFLLAGGTLLGFSIYAQVTVSQNVSKMGLILDDLS